MSQPKEWVKKRYGAIAEGAQQGCCAAQAACCGPMAAAPDKRECGGAMMGEMTIHGVNVRRPGWFAWGGLASAFLSLVWVAGCGMSSAATQASSAPTAAKPENAAATAFPSTPVGQAIVQAGKDGKYSFVLFYRSQEQASEAMTDTFSRAQGILSARAVFLPVDIDSNAESELIGRFRAQQAPLPLTLVIAPNGAIVRSFTNPVDEQALADAFVSPKIAEVTKALQDGKLVALCLQGPSTNHNSESNRAAEAFVADERLSGQGVLVVADPSREAELIERCRMSAPPTEATIVLLVPPGTIVATVAGATTKEALLQQLQSASASCSSGSCGPSGCQ